MSKKSNFHKVYEIAILGAAALRRGEDVSKRQKKIDKLNAAELIRVFPSMDNAAKVRAQATLTYLENRV